VLHIVFIVDNVELSFKYYHYNRILSVYWVTYFVAIRGEVCEQVEFNPRPSSDTSVGHIGEKT